MAPATGIGGLFLRARDPKAMPAPKAEKARTPKGTPTDLRKRPART
jgi:hypothetical protein